MKIELLVQGKKIDVTPLLAGDSDGPPDGYIDGKAFWFKTMKDEWWLGKYPHQIAALRVFLSPGKFELVDTVHDEVQMEWTPGGAAQSTNRIARDEARELGRNEAFALVADWFNRLAARTDRKRAQALYANRFGEAKWHLNSFKRVTNYLQVIFALRDMPRTLTFTGGNNDKIDEYVGKAIQDKVDREHMPGKRPFKTKRDAEHDERKVRFNLRKAAAKFSVAFKNRAEECEKQAELLASSMSVIFAKGHPSIRRAYDAAVKYRSAAEEIVSLAETVEI